jgi:nitroreductase
VEFEQLLQQRRMVRAFDGTPIAPDVLERILDAARRAPSAGNSQGWGFVVLEGPETHRFWDVTLPEHRRAAFRFPQLLDAPVIVLPLADKRAYLSRYSEPDKEHTGLAEESHWPVPYWQIDTAFAAMLLLLAAENEGLGALFFGVFRDGDRLLSELGVPDDLELIGAIALGQRAPADEVPGRSADRERRPLEEVVHRGAW